MLLIITCLVSAIIKELTMNHEHVLCIINAMFFSVNVQMPNNSLCIHQMYMLELSPASTQCTHTTAVKLFCRYFDLMTIEPSSISRSLVDFGMDVPKMSRRLTLMLEVSE